MLLLAAALSLSPAPPLGEDWVFFGSTPLGATFVDVDSLTSDGDIRTIDVLVVARGETDGIIAERGAISFDCKSGQRRIGAGTAYDAGGKATSHGGTGWREVRPETSHAVLMDVLCTGKPFVGRHFGARLPIREARSAMESERTRESVVN